tara:strand:+ start:1293 stop:1481 length:189 start_codon:yes stop_codon:yes gene_type:complete
VGKKRKKQKHKSKSATSPSFRKSLRHSTHPVPSEKVEETEKKYDRRKSKEEIKKEIVRSVKE